MTFDRDAWPFVAIAALPTVVAAAVGRFRLALGLATIPAAVLAFFRDPSRAVDLVGADDPDEVRSPADGKVMSVGAVEPDGTPEAAGPGWQQIVIFLSVADVHINRAAYGGRVADVSYRPGRFLAAFTPESGIENERSEIVVERIIPDGTVRTVVSRQIVGMLARRVVTRVRTNQVLTTGQRIGLMKFGSRMDVFLPPEVEVTVSVGDKVVGAETVLARWPEASAS